MLFDSLIVLKSAAVSENVQEEAYASHILFGMGLSWKVDPGTGRPSVLDRSGVCAAATVRGGGSLGETGQDVASTVSAGHHDLGQEFCHSWQPCES